MKIFKKNNDGVISENGHDFLLTALNGTEVRPVTRVSHFATTGFLSRLSFSWMNPLMKKGYEKVLDEIDIPLLCDTDRSEARFLLFTQEIEKQKNKVDSSPVLRAMVNCHWKDMVVSGFCALIKILTLSSGPLLLNSFIKFSEKGGRSRSVPEGLAFAMAFLVLKSLEAVAQRQWYFRCRTTGIQVKSLLSAAIYRKQLKLSSMARFIHSSGEITNYVVVDAHRIGEFPFWFHKTWTICLQIIIALIILFNIVGLATVSGMTVIVLIVIVNIPLAKVLFKFQTKLMEAQDVRLKAMTEALVNMKILKLYAWEKHFKSVIEVMRKVELEWLSAFQVRKAFNSALFWASPILVSAATFSTCYLLKIKLDATNVFTFVATLGILQDPIRDCPDVITSIVQARVSFSRIVKFLEAPELQTENVRQKYAIGDSGHHHPVVIKSASFCWEDDPRKPNLRNINLEIKHKDKVAICGEVGSGKSTLLAAILGEIPTTKGLIEVHGKIAYVSQTSWIPQSTLQENILFGSAMDEQRYQETLEKCSLVKDISMLPHGDLTVIGERGVNLSGGQKQRLQLARALYQDSDLYLLDDPFSAVDAHTATNLFNDYVMNALSEKTVLLVTHQVDFLPAFDSVLLMSNGEILHKSPYSELMISSREFQDLVNAHREAVGSETSSDDYYYCKRTKHSTTDIRRTEETIVDEDHAGGQLIEEEQREAGDTGLRPYIQYINQRNRGFLYFSLGILSHIMFIAGQISQNSWMAAGVQNPRVTQLRLILVYLSIGVGTIVFVITRSISIVVLGLGSSESLFSELLTSLFRAPMAFFDSTPLGRILTRVSSDLNFVDLDLPFKFMFSVALTLDTYSNLGVLAAITWQVLFVSIPMVYLTIRLQNYYFATAKELMRINGTTKSLVANHLAESIAGSTTIRAFEEEDRFCSGNLELVDRNASPFFHIYIASEWVMLRLEIMSAVVLSSTALLMALLPEGSFSPGFVGMALSYGLSLNNSLLFSTENQCTLTNYIISVERLNQYMNITSEDPGLTTEHNKPAPDWPAIGRVEIQDLKYQAGQYRKDAPLVLRGLSCTFEDGHKIGIVGRTGSGKTTLISALFRLVEPAGGKIVVDGLDISTVSLHDLRSRFAIIPQEPTLFNGTVRYNLDPLGQYTDQEIWEVLDKCQLRETVKEKKENGLDSSVFEDGSNWSLGQRQLFCLCRALLRRSRILVLDEATASIDNATDSILQRIIRAELADSTVITVAHRIPTVVDCTMVLAITDGRLVEFDKPEKLMQTDGSLFQKLVKEYWSHAIINASMASSIQGSL